MTKARLAAAGLILGAMPALAGAEAPPAPPIMTPALRLADGLNDSEATCTIYVASQRAGIARLAAGWHAADKAAAAAFAFRETAPVFSAICRAAVAECRPVFERAVTEELSEEERGIVDRFLASSAGTKFILALRADMYRNVGDMMGPSGDDLRASLTPAEKEIGSRTFATAAWSRYKALKERHGACFGEAQARATAPFADELRRRLDAARAAIEKR